MTPDEIESLWAFASREKRLFTGAELIEIWRPHSGFVGPSMPPMIAWLKAGSQESAWRRPVAASLFEWAERRAV